MKELILRHKLFFGTIIFLILLIIPLTVLQVQQQQDLRQRASGENTSLYFAREANCSDHLTNLSLTSGQSAPIYLCLEASNDYTSGISGFNIIFSADNNLSFQSVEPSNNATAFNTPIFQEISNQNKTVHFAKISTENNVTTTPLSLLKLNVIGTGTGSISITTAEITSLTQDPYISAQTTSLSYDVTAQTPIVCSNLSSNGKPNVCSNNSGTCLLADYTRYGFTEATGVAGSIYGTDCTSTATPSRVCCYYSPTIETAVAPTATPIPGAPTATPVPTSTPTPIPTPVPAGTTSVAFKIALLEIADNPKRENRKLKIEILDPLDNNKTITALTDKDISNDKTVKQFKGIHALDASFKSGIYNIKVKTDGYLRKLIPAVPITKGIQNNIVLATLTPGDINDDNKVNILDYAFLRDCFGNKANTPTCKNKLNSDLNDDGVVDGIDYNAFIKGLSEKEGD